VAGPPLTPLSHLTEIALLHFLRSPEMSEVSWRELYRAAVLELDPVLLQVRVKAAEDAINARLADVQIPRDEHRDIDDAISALRRLKRRGT
jgi:hypothetical protein